MPVTKGRCRMKDRKPYKKPVVSRVRLRADDAVLAWCREPFRTQAMCGDAGYPSEYPSPV